MSQTDQAPADGLIQGQITDETIALMRERFGYPNPTLRNGILEVPWNTAVSTDALRHWAWSIGDDNPMYVDPDYGASTRWGGPIAPPGFEMTMGVKRNKPMTPEFEKRTRGALRGVQLFHSGGENFYYAPLTVGTRLCKAEWVQDVQVKQSQFASKSAIVTNGLAYWDASERTVIDGCNWFVHTERRKTTDKDKYAKDEPARYTDEQLAEIEAAYDNEYRRGRDTLYLEDVAPGQVLPRMAKGPITITDQINFYMGAGWLTYGNPPFRLAHENRKRLRGFYSRNEFNGWDTIQRVHWDANLAQQIGVKAMYDIGPIRWAMVCHYLTNWAGDDAFVHRVKYEFRRFNYMGDTTWIQGTVTAARVDERLGPLVELDITGVNQRGHENIRASATVLVASRRHGPARLPSPPPVTPHRAT
ncbi:MAG: MaoC family dehydratase N-terminal domain-containing protein [Gammaproteobacteria bacterium]